MGPSFCLVKKLTGYQLALVHTVCRNRIMTRKKSHLTEEDRALWKAVATQIEPHKKTDTHRKKRSHQWDDEPLATPRRDTEKSKKKNWQTLTHHPAAAPAKKQVLSHELPSIAADVSRHIKTKKRRIDARLDLHGMTQEAAHRKVIAFIHAAYQNGKKTVLVITGKGKNAGLTMPNSARAVVPSTDGTERMASEGVLQKNLPRWLSADATTAKHISGISSAPRELGGAGAFVITLKRQR